VKDAKGSATFPGNAANERNLHDLIHFYFNGGILLLAFLVKWLKIKKRLSQKYAPFVILSKAKDLYYLVFSFVTILLPHYAGSE
jgi:hypothetical protein